MNSHTTHQTAADENGIGAIHQQILDAGTRVTSWPLPSSRIVIRDYREPVCHLRAACYEENQSRL